MCAQSSSPDLAAAPSAPRPPQFTLRTLLGWMLLSSIYFAAIYWFGWWGGIFGSVALFLCFLSAINRVAALAIAGILVVFFLLLASGEFGSRPASRRSTCQNHLRQIALALQNYHDTYGVFPPAYIADESGKPIHSWRVLLLPFLGETQLYDRYRFDEPWDGPHNRQLHSHALSIFQCPSAPPAKTDTNYVVVVGAGTMFPNDGCVSMADIKDGASNTLMVVEIRDSGIHWMEPRDLHVTQMATTINPAHGQGISSHHFFGKKPIAQAARADGSVFALGDPPPETLRALLTIAGGEKIGDDDE